MDMHNTKQLFNKTYLRPILTLHSSWINQILCTKLGANKLNLSSS